MNPFTFGMIGPTDSHSSLVAVEEENFFGKHSGTEPSPARAMRAPAGVYSVDLVHTELMHARMASG